MNNITVIELNNKSLDGLVLKVEDINHIKFNLELSYDRLIEKINESIKECNFQQGREHYLMGKKLYKNDSKINSLGFILEQRAIKEKYENINNLYDLLKIKNELTKLLKSILYLSKIEESEEYKKAYEEAMNIKSKINEEEILNSLNQQVKDISKCDKEKVLLLIKDIFRNEYENNFYNSTEFINNIIENDIYRNVEDFYNLKKALEKIYLLYKFNLEKDINKKVSILYKINISEFMNIEYVYKPYAVKFLEKNKYETLNELKNDLLNISTEIKKFNKKSMPI